MTSPYPATLGQQSKECKMKTYVHKFTAAAICTIKPICSRAAASFVVGLLAVVHAHATDINGAWATTSSELCAKIFVKANNSISFAKDSDAYGSGFIVDGNELRGKIAKCHVKSRKDKDSMIVLLAECATDISFSKNEFRLRIDDNNKITRIFSGYA
jgi:hypothetical protein